MEAASSVGSPPAATALPPGEPAPAPLAAEQARPGGDDTPTVSAATPKSAESMAPLDLGLGTALADLGIVAW